MKKAKLIKCRKVKLKKIMREINDNGEDNHKILFNVVARTNQIVINTLHFLELYLLYLYENNQEFPKIDRKFILTIMKLTSVQVGKRGGKDGQDTIELKEKLSKFYDSFFKQTLINDKISCDKLSHVLEYEAEKIVSQIETNISFHFVQHLNKLVNIMWRRNDKLKKAKTNSERKLVNDLISNVRKDIYNTKSTEFTSLKEHHQMINIVKNEILFKKTIFQKDNIAYDVKVNPQDYLKSMISINKKIVELNELYKEENKLFHVLPQRTNIVFRYITLDTASILQIFSWKGSTKYQKNIELYKKKIWKKVFQKSKLFRKKDYVFHGMIQTDGIGCSILFSRDVEKSELKNKSKNKEFEYITKQNAKNIKDKNQVFYRSRS